MFADQQEGARLPTIGGERPWQEEKDGAYACVFSIARLNEKKYLTVHALRPPTAAAHDARKRIYLAATTTHHGP